MRTYLFPSAFLLLFATITFSARAANKTHALYEKALPSVVTVFVPSLGAAGSGFAIENGNLALTAFHVVGFEKQVEIEPSGGPMKGKRFKATVLGRDPELDLAVLEIAGATKLTPLAFASPAQMKVGEAVATVGSPLMLKASLTDGKVTGPIRKSERFPNPAWLQTSLALLPGNSGGPVLDSAGKVVGIAIGAIGVWHHPNAVGYVISSDEITRSDSVLKRKKDIVRGSLGIDCKELDAGASLEAELKPLGLPKGKTPCFVLGVVKGSTAEKAGVRKFALITKMDGKHFDVTTLRAEVMRLPIGTPVSLDAVVDQKPKNFRVKVEALPLDPAKRVLNVESAATPFTPPVAKPPQQAPFGIVVLEASAEQCKEAKIEGACRGLAVNQIAYDSPGEKLPYGSVIVAVDGKAVATQTEYYSAIGAKKSVQLTVFAPDEGKKTIAIP